MSDSDVSEVGGSEVVVAEDPNGALLIGDDSAIAEFVARWQAEGAEVVAHSKVTGMGRVAAISKAADLGFTGASAVHYVRLHKAVGTAKGETAVIRMWVKAANGKIISNKAISPATLARTNPAATLGMIAVRAALTQAVEEITDAVERVEGKTDDVLRLANADRTGDVNGHYRLLRRRVAQLDQGAQLTDTDWSTVASLGPALEVGVERLRAYATRLVGDLPAGLKADERAERLDKAVQEGKLAETLRLLIVAEQSLYLWQRLRVERVEHSEPEHLDQAIAGAHATLAEHLHADAGLVEQLRMVLREYGVLQPLEFYRKLSGRKLRKHVGELRGDLDYFVQARGIQVGTWDPMITPTARDAISAAKVAAVESGRAVRAVAGMGVDVGLAGISKVGSTIQNTAERLRGNDVTHGPDPRPRIVAPGEEAEPKTSGNPGPDR